MRKSTVVAMNAPSAIGPYSQAIKTDSLVFVSGQLPMDPVSGNLIQGNIKDATRQAMKNLKEILTSAGSSLDNVVKTTLFITDMNNFSAPARACVEVSGLPKGAKIEVEAVALLNEL
jgi:2-iminobutanoate/2-iminopropanoate deaminase